MENCFFILDKSVITLGYWKKGVRLHNRPCDCHQGVPFFVGQWELAGSQPGSQTRLPQDTSTKRLKANIDNHLNLAINHSVDRMGSFKCLL